MNWYKNNNYKISQQQLMFYPWDSPHYESPSQRVRPISKDPSTGEDIYQCNECKNSVLEEDVAYWVEDRR